MVWGALLLARTGLVGAFSWLNSGGIICCNDAICSLIIRGRSCSIPCLWDSRENHPPNWPKNYDCRLTYACDVHGPDVDASYMMKELYTTPQLSSWKAIRYSIHSVNTMVCLCSLAHKYCRKVRTSWLTKSSFPFRFPAPIPNRVTFAFRSCALHSSSAYQMACRTPYNLNGLATLHFDDQSACNRSSLHLAVNYQCQRVSRRPSSGGFMLICWAVQRFSLRSVSPCNKQAISCLFASPWIASIYMVPTSLFMVISCQSVQPFKSYSRFLFEK